jgi:ribosomal protein L7/L12
MLTGQLPLGRFLPPSQKVQVDVRLDEVVLRALEREPERRYQQASEVKATVETITATPPPSGAGALAAGETADAQLEQAILKLLPDKKYQAITEYRDRTGVGLKEAREAVEAIARKHGIVLVFPPVPWWKGVLILMALGIAVALWVWLLDTVSPILAYPLVFVLSIPLAVKAWRLRGTPGGRRTALWAGFCFLTIVGIPLTHFVADPEPVLNRLYALTGAVPGRNDVLFVQVLVGSCLVGVVVWWFGVLRQLLAKPRGDSR